MAIPMTPSRFGNSYSGASAPYNTADAPSMADTLPSVDFAFADLRDRMANFTARFDDFIERGRKRVLEERNTFRMNVAELQEASRTKLHTIADLETKSTALSETLEKEAQETEELHSAVSSLKLQKSEHATRRSELQDSIAQTQASIKAHREAQNAHARALEAQARHNVPELRFWEACLGLRIEGTEEGGEMLRFVFACVDGRDEGREVWFELDAGKRDFEVVGTEPGLEREEVDAAVERANEGRELVGLLKGMRGLFVQALKD